MLVWLATRWQWKPEEEWTWFFLPEIWSPFLFGKRLTHLGQESSPCSAFWWCSLTTKTLFLRSCPWIPCFQLNCQTRWNGGFPETPWTRNGLCVSSFCCSVWRRARLSLDDVAQLNLCGCQTRQFSELSWILTDHFCWYSHCCHLQKTSERQYFLGSHIHRWLLTLLLWAEIRRWHLGEFQLEHFCKIEKQMGRIQHRHLSLVLTPWTNLDPD